MCYLFFAFFTFFTFFAFFAFFAFFTFFAFLRINGVGQGEKNGPLGSQPKAAARPGSRPVGGRAPGQG